MVDSYDFPFEEVVIFLQFSGFFVGKVDFEVPVHIEYLVPQVGGIGKDALCEFCRAAADIPSEIGAHHHVFHHFIGRAESDVVLFRWCTAHRSPRFGSVLRYKRAGCAMPGRRRAGQSL